jgi:murein DD-endopeptidase MepM/ murein hydrolase activator NlpD
MTKPGISLHKISIGLFAAILLVVTFIAILQSNRSKLWVLTAKAYLESTPTPESTNSQTTVALPVFHTPENDSQNGIPRLALLDTTIPERPTVDVRTYVVQPGDNLFKIAEKFGLLPETVLWGNYEVLRVNPQFLRPEQKLSILPTDGVYYQWAEDDDLQKIAEFFRVEPEAIVEYPGNRLISDLIDPNPVEIAAGSWVIVPGGKRDLKDWGPPAITRKNPAAAAYYGAGYCGKVYEGSIGIRAFIWPTVATSLSGYDYSPTLHPGIDIAGAQGNAVFASDSGVVVYAGWSQYGFGYLIVLDHGNGWQSAYAHLSAVNVGCGESVVQGKVIGAIGSTGNSTGPHLHFELHSEIYGKVNPWDFVSP